MPLRLREGVVLVDDGDEDVVSGDPDRGRLALDVEDTRWLRIRGIGDVDETEQLLLAVGIDQGAAVLGGGDDLGHRLDIFPGIQKDREGGYAAKVALATSVIPALVQEAPGRQVFPVFADPVAPGRSIHQGQCEECNKAKLERSSQDTATRGCKHLRSSELVEGEKQTEFRVTM